MARQGESHARSLADPHGFWVEAAESVEWFRRWDRVRDDAHAPLVRWFAGGIINTCHNALDRHVAAGRGAQTALVYDRAMTGAVRAFSYRQLRDEVARFAGALACARLGAVHSVVFGGFAARKLATRIDDARPAGPRASCETTGGTPSR